MSFNPKQRQSLFLEMARVPGGTTAQDVFEVAQQRGDDVSIEAYFNLGRRLAHRGMLKSDKSGERTAYSSTFDENSTWLDEDQLVMLVDPTYPVLALTAYRESQRQARDIPDSVWIEARQRLASTDAQQLFFDGICAYSDNLRDEVEHYVHERSREPGASHLSELRHVASGTLGLLVQMCKDGLGLSDEAIRLPVTVDVAAEMFVSGTLPGHFYDPQLLRDELGRRIEPGPFIRGAEVGSSQKELLVAGVDGSSVGGLLSLDGAGGDFAFGHAPQVSINAATGVLNRDIKVNARRVPAFLRLPEKPEDMQQRDNRYTIMAKMFFPDLTDSEYVHSTWNAMDLLECRATLAVMSRWTTAVGNVEVSAADVVFRDGTVVPNDRDSAHYGQQNNYGRIVRDLVEANWKIAKNCRDDSQTVVGVVKNAQLRVVSPVVNHYLCQLAASKSGETQFAFWSLVEMNLLFDQTLMTRLLTAGRKSTDPWWRTALILRPFHATTNFGKNASRSPGRRPYDKIVARSEQAKLKPVEELTQEDEWWRGGLRVPGDPYLQMITGVWYAGFYLGAHPRLDRSELLPRMEFVLPHSTLEEGSFPTTISMEHIQRVLDALRQVDFDVAKEHAMYDASERIDLLPRILIRAHDTVKTWAKELRDRVSEYMDWHLVRYLTSLQKRSLRLRPWKRRELEAWIDAMQHERRKQAGSEDLKVGTSRDLLPP